MLYVTTAAVKKCGTAIPRFPMARTQTSRNSFWKLIMILAAAVDLFSTHWMVEPLGGTSASPRQTRSLKHQKPLY
jgi:hypothetical protein